MKFKVGKITLDPLVHKEEFSRTGYKLEGERSLFTIYPYISYIHLSLSQVDLSNPSGGSSLEKDLYHFSLLWEAWQSLIDSGLMTFNFSITVDTEVDKGITVPGTGSLEWPRLPYQSSSTIHFPLTLIGNSSVRVFSEDLFLE